MPRAVEDRAQALAARLRAGPRALAPQARPGPGAAFWQFREYRPGEAASGIDWRASARSIRPIVREREWEAPRHLAVWAEEGPDMAFSSVGETKADAAAVIGRALQIAAGQGSTHPEAGADSAFLFIGAFWAPTPDLPPAVHGFVLHLVDPAEADLPYAGPHVFEGHGCTAHIGDPDAARAAYKARVEAHCAALQAFAARRGWGYVLQRTDRDLLPGAAAAWEALGLVHF
ncbi:MAG: DUF58 domain-containing protein [Alphaproteobacteria bacterium]|jgi:uncharacterized protein (DUF58 family)|nr:DUF58 domain-containing protein [Alphaproteobacteria bacterium]